MTTLCVYSPMTGAPYIDAINDMAKELKFRASCETYWKVNYHYEGKHIMCIGTDKCGGFNGRVSPVVQQP